MKNSALVFLATFLYGQSIMALDVSIESGVYASHPNYLLATDLFNNSSLPPALANQLKSVIWNMQLPQGKSTELKQKDLLKWIRGPITEYEKSTGQRISLHVPKQVLVYSHRDKFGKDQFKDKLMAQAKKQCQSCKVEVSFKNFPRNNYIGKWNVSTSSGIWRGKVLAYLHLDDQTLEVPTEIRLYDRVVLAKRKIPIGRKIKKSDLKVQDLDVTFLNDEYARKIDKVQGMLATKDFRPHQVINPEALKKPNVVIFGQSVSLIMDEDQWSVTVSAKARGAGAIGDRIQVFIPRTKKKVMAKIIDKDKVRIE